MKPLSPQPGNTPRPQNPSATPENAQTREIDAALRLLAPQPRTGLPLRVLAHLQAADMSAQLSAHAGHRSVFLPRFASATLAAAAVAGILTGSIVHGRHVTYRPAVHIGTPGTVLSPAARPVQPSAPVQTMPTLHGRPGRHTRHGRAEVPLQTRKPNGIGTPRSPMVPTPQPEDPNQP